MTNLSKELCEICGIEPKLDGSNPALSVQPGYPDFTKPENFVKLYNLSLASKHTPTLARFMSFEYSVINNSEDFIKKLVECLEDNIDVNFIKQAIRETEWVYE